jgi:hypothetical protein
VSERMYVRACVYVKVRVYACVPLPRTRMQIIRT